MSYPQSTIDVLGDDGFHVADYTETPHYMDSKRFLNDHERMRRMLPED